VSARRGSGDVLAHALPQSFGRLPTGALAHAVAIAFVEPRGTHAPRSWSRASGGRVRTCAESSSQARLPQPRGAYAPRSWSCAFAGRRNCDFCDAQTHMHRSGGCEPAVVLETYLHTRFRNCLADCRRCVGGHRCNRVRVITGSLRPPRSWSWRRSCIAKVAFSPSREGRPPRAAGVSPPWLEDAHARKIANRKWVHIHAASGAAA